MRSLAICAGVWILVPTALYTIVYARRAYLDRRDRHATLAAYVNDKIREHEDEMIELDAEAILIDAAHQLLASGDATPLQIVAMFDDTPNPKDTP